MHTWEMHTQSTSYPHEGSMIAHGDMDLGRVWDGMDPKEDLVSPFRRVCEILQFGFGDGVLGVQPSVLGSLPPHRIISS